jgi:hypothetical protein
MPLINKAAVAWEQVDHEGDFLCNLDIHTHQCETSHQAFIQSPAHIGLIESQIKSQDPKKFGVLSKWNLLIMEALIGEPFKITSPNVTGAFS